MIASEDKAQILQRVNNAIESIRPHLVADSGDIEVIEVTDEGIVKIQWKGTCESCSMNNMTMAGIEHIIKSNVPEVKGVKAV